MRQGPQTRTATAVNGARDGRRDLTHLNVHKLHKREAPARRGHLVLDEDDSPHALRALFTWARARLHGLGNRLRTRERVEPTEEEDWSLRVPDVPSSIVRLEGPLRTPIPWGGALRVIDLDASAARGNRHPSLQRPIERGSRGGTVRGGRWDLDEREERVHEGTRVLGACELGETESLGNTCCNAVTRKATGYARVSRREGAGRKKTSMHCGTL